MKMHEFEERGLKSAIFAHFLLFSRKKEVDLLLHSRVFSQFSVNILHLVFLHLSYLTFHKPFVFLFTCFSGLAINVYINRKKVHVFHDTEIPCFSFIHQKKKFFFLFI